MKENKSIFNFSMRFHFFLIFEQTFWVIFFRSAKNQILIQAKRIHYRIRSNFHFFSGLYEYYDDYSYDEYEYETDLLETVGDADLIICNNLERALYLSLKYEFVTPLTSLVVVTPDVGESEGEFGDLEKAVNFLSTASRISVTTTFLTTASLIMLSIVTFFSQTLNIRFWGRTLVMRNVVVISKVSPKKSRWMVWFLWILS